MRAFDGPPHVGTHLIVVLLGEEDDSTFWWRLPRTREARYSFILQSHKLVFAPIQMSSIFSWLSRSKCFSRKRLSTVRFQLRPYLKMVKDGRDSDSTTNDVGELCPVFGLSNRRNSPDWRCRTRDTVLDSMFPPTERKLPDEAEQKLQPRSGDLSLHGSGAWVSHSHSTIHLSCSL